MTTTSTELPLLIAEIEAVSVERLSPTFVRVEFAGDELADFGVDGELYDQRIKLIFPNDKGELADFSGADETWFDTWLDRPAGERGHMRTYTVRAVRGAGSATRLVVDFAIHEEDGCSGPGSSWAAAAKPGDRLVTIGPRRGQSFGGIEFEPGSAGAVVLVGDETAVPAVSAIVEALPDGTHATAFLEVPVAADILDLKVPAGIEVVWLPRDGAELGERLSAAVIEHLGGGASAAVQVADDEVDPDLWETPAHSSSGEAVAAGSPAPADLYAWIAGESKVVTGLRRHLVKELGMDRRQVAFMGYWRRGVAMRS